MVDILERSVTFQDTSLQTKLAHSFVNVSLQWCATPFGGVIPHVQKNRKRKEAFCELVTHIHAIKFKKKTFYKYSLDGSVEVARRYALLSYGKKRRDIDTFDDLRNTMARTTDKSATVLPPTVDAFKEHVLCAKCHTLIWYKSHVPNQELIELVGHIWSACDDGLITPTMHNLLLLRFET